MSAYPLVVVFIPAYNEEADIAEMIRRAREALSDTEGQGFEIRILVVDDGSTDNTSREAEAAGADRIVRHKANRGLGGATRTAMETAFEMGADVAIKLDADHQHGPEDIPTCVRPLLDGEADVCWGYRVMTYDRPLMLTMGNRFFTWLMNRLTRYRITDAQTGMMAFNREYLSQFEILSNYNPPQQLLIDAWRKNMVYTEVPVSFHPRQNGDSFVSLKYPFTVLVNIVRIMFYGNPFKVFSMLGGGMLGLSFLLLACSLGLFAASVAPSVRPALGVLGLVLFLGGLQTVYFAFMTDYIRFKLRTTERQIRRGTGDPSA